MLNFVTLEFCLCAILSHELNHSYNNICSQNNQVYATFAAKTIRSMQHLQPKQSGLCNICSQTNQVYATFAASHSYFYYTSKPECAIPDDNLQPNKHNIQHLQPKQSGLHHICSTLVLKCNKNNYD
jgi:hypothetical protein